ncbi:hypothetical protein SUGI_0440400 [Cryptomeria japonica]|nr:hypothetical protein SUGI_0440400 [Cryptomeria japonica]
MGKKRKQPEKSEEIQTSKEEENVRPKRTLLGWKAPPQEEKDKENNANDSEKRIFRNREKILVICSRRIVYRYRHLMMDIVSLLPHCKKDNKVESKENKGATLNELVELRNCTGCLFFECRKLKFLVNAVHTMEELKLTGNHLKALERDYHSNLWHAKRS